VPRAGLEPATSVFYVDSKRLHEDLEAFRLFARVKLNLSKVTVVHYVCKDKADLKV
jgi:hypothetical protein